MPSYKSFLTSLSYHTITRPAIDLTKRQIGKWVKHNRYASLKHYHHKLQKRRLFRNPNANKPLGKQGTTLTKAQVQRDAYRARQHAFRIKLRAKTRGDKADSKTHWSKNTASGIANREKALKKAKAVYRPTRRRTGDIRAIKLTPSQKRAARAKAAATPRRAPQKPTAAQTATIRKIAPGTPEAAAIRSNNYGVLRRRLGGQAVRSVTRKIINKGGTINRKQRADTIRALRKHAVYRQLMRNDVRKEKARRMVQASAFLAKNKNP